MKKKFNTTCKKIQLFTRKHFGWVTLVALLLCFPIIVCFGYYTLFTPMALYDSGLYELATDLTDPLYIVSSAACIGVLMGWYFMYTYIFGFAELVDGLVKGKRTYEDFNKSEEQTDKE